MTVRIKILALSVSLLLIFAVVLMGSVAMQRRTSHQVAAIIDFHLPLAAVIADLDVATDEYELVAMRLLAAGDVTAEAVEVGRRDLARNKERIATDFQRADALLKQALADPRTDPADRLVLAQVQRSLVFLKRLQAPYFALGEEVVTARRRPDEGASRPRPAFQTFRAGVGT